MNAASKRNDYHGELRALVNALIRTIYGGQVIVEERTYQGITHPSGTVAVQALDLTDLKEQARYAPVQCLYAGKQGRSSGMINKSVTDQTSCSFRLAAMDSHYIRLMRP